METAPSGQMIRIIVIQLTRTSLQPLFSLSIFSIILLTFRCCLLYLYYTLYRQFVKGFCRFFSKFFRIDVSCWYQRTYGGDGSPAGPKSFDTKGLCRSIHLINSSSRLRSAFRNANRRLRHSPLLPRNTDIATLGCRNHLR